MEILVISEMREKAGRINQTKKKRSSEIKSGLKLMFNRALY